MSILDDIANPQVPNYLQGLQTVENIQTARENRRINEIKTGMALQQIMQQRQAANTIQQFLRPPTPEPTQQAPAPAPSEGPPTREGVPAAQAMPKDVSEKLFAPFISAPTELMQRSKTTRDLADTLAAQPGNQEIAKQFYDMSNYYTDLASKESKQERDYAQQMFANMGNNFYQIAKLEDQGNQDQAKALYNQTKDLIMKDPRFGNDPHVQQFFQMFPEYQPGLGKYIYTTTMYGQKARDQFQEQYPPEKAGDAGTYTKDTNEGFVGVFDKGTNEFIKYLKGPDGKPMKTFAAGKEAAIQSRYEGKMQALEAKQKLTNQKFVVNSTDKIITYKRQEEKDLKQVRSSLQRAIVLADKGENMPLVDKLLKQGVSKLENTSIRAYAELQQFANIGDLTDRISGNLSQFLFGEMTDSQRKMILDTTKTLLKDFINPELDQSNDYWRRIASESGFDPDQVATYKTKEEVGRDLQNGIISREQAARILAKPRFKWPTKTQ